MPVTRERFITSTETFIRSLLRAVSAQRPIEKGAHVKLIRVRHLQHAGTCEVQREMHEVANSGQRTANF